MKEEFCPHCEDIRTVSEVRKTDTLPVLGEPVEYEAHLYQCSTCGQEFAPLVLEDENLKRAYSIYRERHGLLAPERIRQIRELYGLSQRNFSKFLRWGEITTHRYEAGAIQDAAHNDTLALLDDPRNAQKLFELNKDNLPTKVAQELKARIKELLSESIFEACFVGYRDIRMGKEKVDEIFSGNKTLDTERLENLVLYILEKFQGVVKTKLNKLLWYCDFYNYKLHNISITGTKYIHLQYGPVPDDYDLLLWDLSIIKKIASEEIIYDSDISGEKYKALEAPDISIFSPEELDNIEYVLNLLGPLTARQLTDKSHEEEGYKATEQLEPISYSYASTLSI